MPKHTCLECGTRGTVWLYLPTNFCQNPLTTVQLLSILEKCGYSSIFLKKGDKLFVRGYVCSNECLWLGSSEKRNRSVLVSPSGHCPWMLLV